MTIQSDKVTIRGFYSVMINFLAVEFAAKGYSYPLLLEQPGIATVLHLNMVESKRAAQLHSKYICLLLCPSSFTNFPLDSHKEFQKYLKSTLIKQFHGCAEPGHCQKKGPEKDKYSGTECWKTVQNIVFISDSHTSESVTETGNNKLRDLQV